MHPLLYLRVRVPAYVSGYPDVVASTPESEGIVESVESLGCSVRHDDGSATQTGIHALIVLDMEAYRARVAELSTAKE